MAAAAAVARAAAAAAEPTSDPRSSSHSEVSGDLVAMPTLMSDEDLVDILSKKHVFARTTQLGLDMDRGICSAVVDSKCFEMVVTCTVLCNIIQMGLEADYPDLTDVWVLCENIATSIFVCEMILKIISKKLGYFRERSNWVDAALTILGVIDCWILASMPSSSADLQSTSILRGFRLIRLARVSKIARKIKAVALVFTGLLHALEATIWVLVGLIFIMFVFAIFCTQYIGRPEDGIYPGYSVDSEVIDGQEIVLNYNPHLLFGSMWTSMLTLFSIAIGSDWSDIVRPLAIKQPVFVLLFLAYCILIVFGLMNVILAIIVENVIEESKKMDQELHEAQKARKKRLVHRIQNVLDELDKDLSQTLTYDEIHAGFQNSGFQALLRDCDFPAGWSARELINMLDTNGDGCLEKAEFTRNVFRLLDGDDFQHVCIMQADINYVKQHIRASHSKLEHQIKEVQESIGKLQATQFSVGMSANVHKANLTAGAEEQMIVLDSQPSHTGLYQPLANALGAGLPEPSGNARRFQEPLAQGLASSSRAERTRQQLTLELSLEKAVQQMRDFLERTEAIVSIDARSQAAVEKQQDLLTQAGRRAASTESRSEQELLTQATIAACSDAMCRELEHTIKTLSCKEFEGILEAAFATMRESLHKEVALPGHAKETPLAPPSGIVQEASCTQVQAMNTSGQESSSVSHARDEEPGGPQPFRQMKKLSEGVQGALRCCATAQSEKALRTGEIVNVPVSL